MRKRSSVITMTICCTVIGVFSVTVGADEQSKGGSDIIVPTLLGRENLISSRASAHLWHTWQRWP